VLSRVESFQLSSFRLLTTGRDYLKAASSTQHFLVALSTFFLDVLLSVAKNSMSD